MVKDKKQQSMELFINDAIRGKPFLDIDRVIPEGERITEKKDRK